MAILAMLQHGRDARGTLCGGLNPVRPEAGIVETRIKCEFVQRDLDAGLTGVR